MFKNVLVGVDGRPNGRDAITLASRLADGDGTVTFAHVHQGQLHPSHAVTPGLLAQEREASEKLLMDARSAAGVDASLISIVASTPGRGLHEQAEDQRADLLVVGSCSRGSFGRAMIGDDTRAALNGASCAVAIAPRGYAEQPTPLTKIGVAYNDSPESQMALAIAKELAGPLHASVHAREVVTIPTVAYTGMLPPPIGDSIDEMVKQATSRMQALPDVEGSAVYGLPGEELAQFGDEVDLLVIGSRSYGPVKRLVHGSTSDHLARHARCALLVLPRASAAEHPEEGRRSSETAQVASG